MFRHLPPTATPLPQQAFAAGITAAADAVEQFEGDFTRYANVAGCLTAASGRTALYLFLSALKRHADQPTRTRVVMPGYTCPSLARVTIDAGLDPHFVDIDPASMAYDLDGLANAVDERVLAVICVHPFGMVQAVEPIMRLAHATGAVVLEDAAQSMGAIVNDQLAGTRSDYGLFSLGPGKALSAGGGGIITINHGSRGDHIMSERAQLAKQSVSGSPLALVRLAAFSMAFHPVGWWLATRTGVQKAGDNEANWGFRLQRLTPAQAAVASRQLPRLDAYNRVRNMNAQRIMESVAAYSWVSVPQDHSIDTDAGPIYLRLPILVDSEARRQTLFEGLWSRGIGVGRMYKRTMDRFFPANAGRDLPGARHVADHLLTLPTHHYVNARDIQAIAETIATVDG